MRRKIFSSLLLIASLFGSQLLFTGCEKNDSKKSTEPVGWFKAGNRYNNYTISTDNQNAQQGQNSGYIESVVDTTTGYGVLMQNCSEKNFKGERVKMTGYIQSIGSDTTLTTMWIRVDDFDKRITADFDNMMDRPIIGTRYWTKCEIVFDVPESLCVINYGLILNGAGKAWFDNVSFEIVNSSIFKTAYYLNLPFSNEYQIPQNLPEEPVNLDFEE
jgi:hypothetical protein